MTRTIRGHRLSPYHVARLLDLAAGQRHNLPWHNGMSDLIGMGLASQALVHVGGTTQTREWSLTGEGRVVVADLLAEMDAAAKQGRLWER